MKSKMRFRWVEEECKFAVSARRKDTGKYQILGYCHAAAKSDVAAGKLELIQWLAVSK